MLEKAGAVNAAAEDTGWTISADMAVQAEVIFCPEELVDTVKSAEIYASSPAVQNGRVYGVDAAVFERRENGWRRRRNSWPGSCIREAFVISSDVQTI